MEPLYRPPEVSTESVLVFDAERMPWQATASPGLWLKPVRHDDSKGHFLGLIRFDQGTRSGLHQHQGVATSFVLEGGLTDYQGDVRLHEVGINYLGSTHDAMAYRNTILVSRLEAPVTYPTQAGITGVHAGSREGSVANRDPDLLPEINVAVDSIPKAATGIPGVQRQVIYDYVGANRRMAQLSFRPGSRAEFEATALTEFWVRGGLAHVNGQPVHANCFIVCEPGAQVRIESEFGILLLGWAEGPPSGEGNLFGF